MFYRCRDLNNLLKYKIVSNIYVNNMKLNKGKKNSLN